MSFYPDPSKQAVEVYFSRKTGQVNAPVLSFNANSITASEFHKHLGLTLTQNSPLNTISERSF